MGGQWEAVGWSLIPPFERGHNAMSIPGPLRVLLADDYAVVRKGIGELLEEDGGVAVMTEASGRVEAVRLAGERRL